MSTCYLDTSALAKLAVHEAGTPALLAWLAQEERIVVTSALTQVELMRAAARHSRAAVDVAAAAIDRLDVIAMTAEILSVAARLEPASLRTLDAIHLATALAIRADLTSFVVYDRRLIDAAHAADLPVVVP